MLPEKQHVGSLPKQESEHVSSRSDGTKEGRHKAAIPNEGGVVLSSARAIRSGADGEVEAEVGSDNFISSLPESWGKARVVHWRDLIPFYRALRQMHGEIEFLKRTTDDFYLRIEKARGDVREALEVKAKEEEILNRLEEVDRSMEANYVRSREACEEAISAVHTSLWSAIEPLSEFTTTALPGRLEKMEEERLDFLRERKRQQLLVEKLQKQVVSLENSLQTSQRDFKKETDKLKHELRRYQSKVEHLTQQMKTGGGRDPHQDSRRELEREQEKEKQVSRCKTETMINAVTQREPSSLNRSMIPERVRQRETREGGPITAKVSSPPPLREDHRIIPPRTVPSSSDWGFGVSAEASEVEDVVLTVSQVESVVKRVLAERQHAEGTTHPRICKAGASSLLFAGGPPSQPPSESRHDPAHIIPTDPLPIMARSLMQPSSLRNAPEGLGGGFGICVSQQAQAPSPSPFVGSGVGCKEVPEMTIGELLSPFLTRRTAEREGGVGGEFVCQELKAAAASRLIAQGVAAKESAEANGIVLEEPAEATAERARSEFDGYAPSVSLCYSSSFPSRASSVCLRKGDLVLEEKREEPEDIVIGIGEKTVSGLWGDRTLPVSAKEHDFHSSPFLNTQPAPGHNSPSSSHGDSFVPAVRNVQDSFSSSLSFSITEKKKEKEEEKPLHAAAPCSLSVSNGPLRQGTTVERERVPLVVPPMDPRLTRTLMLAQALSSQAAAAEEEQKREEESAMQRERPRSAAENNKQHNSSEVADDTKSCAPQQNPFTRVDVLVSNMGGKTGAGVLFGDASGGHESKPTTRVEGGTDKPRVSNASSSSSVSSLSVAGEIACITTAGRTERRTEPPKYQQPKGVSDDSHSTVPPATPMQAPRSIQQPHAAVAAKNVHGGREGGERMVTLSETPADHSLKHHMHGAAAAAEALEQEDEATMTVTPPCTFALPVVTRSSRVFRQQIQMEKGDHHGQCGVSTDVQAKEHSPVPGCVGAKGCEGGTDQQQCTSAVTENSDPPVPPLAAHPKKERVNECTNTKTGLGGPPNKPRRRPSAPSPHPLHHSVLSGRSVKPTDSLSERENGTKQSTPLRKPKPAKTQDTSSQGRVPGAVQKAPPSRCAKPKNEDRVAGSPSAAASTNKQMNEARRTSPSKKRTTAVQPPPKRASEKEVSRCQILLAAPDLPSASVELVQRGLGAKAEDGDSASKGPTEKRLLQTQTKAKDPDSPLFTYDQICNELMDG